MLDDTQEVYSESFGEAQIIDAIVSIEAQNTDDLVLIESHRV